MPGDWAGFGAADEANSCHQTPLGGGFGGKQEILVEYCRSSDYCHGASGENIHAKELPRRSRHPMRIHMKTGVKRDGTITANE